MYKKILVPLDGSELAEAAIPLAVAIAKATVARLCLLLVSDPGRDSNKAPADPTKYLQKAAEAPSADLQESVDIAVVTSPVSIYRNEAAAYIARFAQSNDVDLIVMSTRGHSGLKRAFEGSVAEALVRTADCPLLFCRPQPGVRMLRPGPHPIRKILISLDRTQSSEGILETAVELASALNAEVVLLHVLQPLRAYASVTGVELADYSPQEWEELHARTDAYLAGVQKRLESAGVKATPEKLIAHDPAAAIMETANRLEVDMITLASRAPQGLVRAIFSSVGDRLVRGASVPVLVIRADTEEKARS